MGDFGYEIQVSLLRDAERADALLGKSKGSFADFGFGGGGGRKGGSARVSPYTVEGAPAPSGLTLCVFNDNNDRNTSHARRQQRRRAASTTASATAGR